MEDNIVFGREVGELIQAFQDILDLESLYRIVLCDDDRRWNAIRRMYQIIDTDHYYAYPVDWTMVFTPIESAAWGEIRSYGIPMWPQYPIGRFFADFADPKKRIIIECDGRQWHDPTRDRWRDYELNELGWTVFRIAGSDCVRMLELPDETSEALGLGEITEEEAEQRITAWYRKTIDGLIASIRHVYYARPRDRMPYVSDLVRRVLHERSRGTFNA